MKGVLLLSRGVYKARFSSSSPHIKSQPHVIRDLQCLSMSANPDDFDRLFEEAFKARVNNGQVAGAPAGPDSSRLAVRRPRQDRLPFIILVTYSSIHLG